MRSGAAHRRSERGDIVAPMPPKYTAEVLAPIVATSMSVSDVMRRLGLTPNGGNHRMVQARHRRAGLDMSHFGAHTLRARVDAILRDQLTELAQCCRTVADLLAKLEMPTIGVTAKWSEWSTAPRSSVGEATALPGMGRSLCDLISTSGAVNAWCFTSTTSTASTTTTSSKTSVCCAPATRRLRHTAIAPAIDERAIRGDTRA
jgi:hypothetical protein